MMEAKQILINNINKIHTTKLGINRLKNNLNIDCIDINKFCIDKILKQNCLIKRQGKNFYCYIDNIKIVINASSYTIITAKKESIFKNLKFVSLKDEPNLKYDAAKWFSSKWGVDEKAYLKCINDFIYGKSKYCWYLCLDNKNIVGGLGVIDNDFHNRKDLKPNLCALYVEKEYRNNKIAKELLKLTINYLKSQSISPMYLVTDHIGFYEQYGWKFCCFVKDEITLKDTRLYIYE